jgi:putative phosphoribosyl transferase
MGVSEIALEKTTAEQLKELERREQVYRGTKKSPGLEGKTVVLIDDGIATGSTFRAAAQAARMLKADQVVVAAPAAALDSCQSLVAEIDELVVLMVPDDFRAVGQWYEDFTQTTDAEVTRLLAEAKQVNA